MLDKIQESLKKNNNERKKRKVEKRKSRLEKIALEAKREQELLRYEEIKINAEKDRLLNLDKKSLMVELIFAMRGLYSQIEYIEAQQEELMDRIESVENDISKLGSDISNLEDKINDSK